MGRIALPVRSNEPVQDNGGDVSEGTTVSEPMAEGPTRANYRPLYSIGIFPVHHGGEDTLTEYGARNVNGVVNMASVSDPKRNKQGKNF